MAGKPGRSGRKPGSIEERKIARNAAIAAYVNAGGAARDMVEQHGLCRARIWQIVRDARMQAKLRHAATHDLNRELLEGMLSVADKAAARLLRAVEGK